MEFEKTTYSNSLFPENEGIMQQTTSAYAFQNTQFTPTNPENEPPLWEELGIDFDLIQRKTLAILNPRKKITDISLLQDTDLGGPFLFCLVLGFCLLLGGKVHLGYIFGYSILGSGVVYLLLNLMSEQNITIGITHTMSVLGYCLLPMIFLALASFLLPVNIAIFMGLAAVIYCTFSASSMFVQILGMKEQQILLAYPMGLLYTCFALIVMF